MGEQWYLNPLKWADEDDYYNIYGELDKHRAIDILTDKLIDRPPDAATMVRGVNRANRVQPLTRKQRSAVDLSREAMMLGQTPTMYVAEKLSINRFSAYKLLQRADMKIQPKMETFEQNVAVSIKPLITKTDIDRQLSRMKVECAGCGKNAAPARTCICHECLMQYGFEGERVPRTAKWLDRMQLMARQDARKLAIDRLMIAQGHIDLSA